MQTKSRLVCCAPDLSIPFARASTQTSGGSLISSDPRARARAPASRRAVNYKWKINNPFCRRICARGETDESARRCYPTVRCARKGKAIARATAVPGIRAARAGARNCVPLRRNLVSLCVNAREKGEGEKTQRRKEKRASDVREHKVLPVAFRARFAGNKRRLIQRQKYVAVARLVSRSEKTTREKEGVGGRGRFERRYFSANERVSSAICIAKRVRLVATRCSQQM